MSLLDTLGELTGFGDSKKAWTLKNDDTGEVIRGQYIAQDYTENVGANLNDSSTVNQRAPFTQWINGEAETGSFRARIFATHSLKFVKNEIDKLKEAARLNKTLKRAPIFTFTYGTEIVYKCFVVSVGGIKYDEVRSDGSIRGAEFNITLRILEDVPTPQATASLASKVKFAAGIATAAAGILSTVGLIKIPGASLHTKGRTIKAKQGDTFESIAQREYGDALVGDILRRVQPEKADLSPGDDVILVDNTEIFQIKVQPQSVALKQEPENKMLLDEKLKARNRPVIKVA
jgi:hypothetical protein